MKRTPVWVVVLSVVSALPVFALPELLSRCPSEPRMVSGMVWGYLVYLVIAAWLAAMCWRQRPVVTVILWVLMWLTTAAIWALVSLPML